jgi:uncharacterized membrane protein
MVAVWRPSKAERFGVGTRSSSAAARRILAALPYLFLVFALAGGLLVALVTPPFMGPDEPNHTYRAYLITLGRPVAGRVVVPDGVRGGGPADRGAIAAVAVFEPMKQQPQAKAIPARYEEAHRFGWTGAKTPTNFQNTAIYGPALYLPQAAGLGLGKALGLTVIDSLTLARVANALACALIGFLALRLAGRARAALFAILLLPMSTFLYGTLTQDGLVITLTALGCAVVSRAASENRGLSARELWAASACFALVAMGKPPCALFGLMLAGARYDGPGPRWPAALFPLITSSLWGAWMSLLVWVTDGAEARQALWLLQHPLAVAPIAWRTLVAHGRDLADQFIGVLGWLDTALAHAFYPAAWVMLALAAALSFGGGRSSAWRGLAPAALLVALAAAGATFFGLYLQWTPLAGPTVEGVQGRYLIPVALVASLALEGEGAALQGWRTWALATVAAFPLVSFCIVNQALVLRYFGH